MYQDIILEALQKASGKKEIDLVTPEISEHGDYSTNIVLGDKNPRERAEELVHVLKKDKKLGEVVSRIEVAGPGFINFWIKEGALSKNLENILREKGQYGSSEIGKGKTVVIDYSSPNIAKRFSVGHLRSTIIGQALYNLYAYLGYKVIGDNHLGDWGTQFGVLIYMVEQAGLDSAKLSVDEWEKLYVEFHQRLEKNPDLKKKSRDAFSRLEKGESGPRKIWKNALKTSLKEYNKIYDLLGVKIDEAYGESFYEDKMPSAIEKAKHKGILKKSKGAWVVKFDKKYNLPTNILVKSNGTTTYLARDLALMYFRKKEWNPDLQIFEVGADQKLYFQQVFALAEIMGIFKLPQLKHVAHGLIRFKDGKMSTRRGKTVKLEDVLEEAIGRAKKWNSDVKASEMVGIGAIKYFDLMHNPTSDIVFDWDKMFVLEGNSGPYLQYTHARAKSVVGKARGQKLKAKSLRHLALDFKLSEEELAVLRSLTHFHETIVSAAKSYSPNILCNYLYKLAQDFNTFYNKEKIVGSGKEEFLVALTAGAAQVLANGLNLLGIQAPERM